MEKLLDDICNKSYNELVISGGAYYIMTQLGILSNIDVSHIKKIYATSAGSIVAILLAIGVKPEEAADYFIKRPWYNVFEIKMPTTGIYDTELVIWKILEPFFRAYDIPKSITLAELNIDIRIYATRMGDFTTYEVPKSTEAIKAISMSCAVPFVFTPIIEGEDAYIDGGLTMNYPIKLARERATINSRIIGIHIHGMDEHPKIRVPTSMFDVFRVIQSRLLAAGLNALDKVERPKTNARVIKEYVMDVKPITDLEQLSIIASSMEERQQLYDIGFKQTCL
jgi:predicted acylesterase/phospholipase RssA